MSMCEGVDSVLLSLVDAIETDDRVSWEMANQLVGDRGAMMRKMRLQYLNMDSPLQELDQTNVLLITNAVEEVFFVLSKVEMEFNVFSDREAHVPHG